MNRDALMDKVVELRTSGMSVVDTVRHLKISRTLYRRLWTEAGGYTSPTNRLRMKTIYNRDVLPQQIPIEPATKQAHPLVQKVGGVGDNIKMVKVNIDPDIEGFRKFIQQFK